MNSEQYILTGDEEYVDVYGIHEFLAAQELAEQEGALVKTGDGCKASVWLTDDETKIVLQTS